MGGFLASVLEWLAGLFLKRPPPPSRVEIQAADAASAKAQLAQQTESAAAETRIAQAVATAPKDAAGVEASLRKGAF